MLFMGLLFGSWPFPSRLMSSASCLLLFSWSCTLPARNVFWLLHIAQRLVPIHVKPVRRLQPLNIPTNWILPDQVKQPQHRQATLKGTSQIFSDISNYSPCERNSKKWFSFSWSSRSSRWTTLCWTELWTVFAGGFSPEETLRRYSMYLEKKSTVDKHNKMYAEGLVSYTLAINKFSIMVGRTD